jgi:hypothetical protein
MSCHVMCVHMHTYHLRHEMHASSLCRSEGEIERWAPTVLQVTCDV